MTLIEILILFWLKLGKKNKLSYLLGNFNLNLMNYHPHSLTGEFVDVTCANLFVPSILRPMRITSYSASLIDNIFANSFCSLPFCSCH